jgi:hypothetical protein
MWEPPAAERMPDEPEDVGIARIAKTAGAKIRDARAKGEVVHVLSHRRLEIVVVGAELRSLGGSRDTGDYQRFELVSKDALAERGVSTLARKVLRAAAR